MYLQLQLQFQMAQARSLYECFAGGMEDRSFLLT
jgi:hypothetical protein